jgi:hypothetical protein
MPPRPLALIVLVEQSVVIDEIQRQIPFAEISKPGMKSNRDCRPYAWGQFVPLALSPGNGVGSLSCLSAFISVVRFRPVVPMKQLAGKCFWEVDRIGAKSFDDLQLQVRGGISKIAEELSAT